MKKFFMILFWGVGMVSFGQSLGELTYLTEDYPPENYLEAGELKGIAVELLRGIWKAAGVSDRPIEVMPWARAYQTALNSRGIVLFSTTRSEARESFFNWVGPIRTASFHLIAPQGTTLVIKSLEEAKRYRIGVLIDDIGESLLLEAGFNQAQLTRVTRIDQLLGMLQLDRLDMISSALPAVKRAMDLNPSRSFAYRSVFKITQESVWYALSKDVPLKTVEQMQAALRTQEPLRQALLNKYRAWE